MFAFSLVVFRETLEAFLITAVLLSLAKKFKLENGFRTIIIAVMTAMFLTFLLLLFGSLSGATMRNFIDEESWEKIEGFLYIFSFVFLTYVIFWLHKHFVKQRAKTIFKNHASIKKGTLLSVFVFTFISVFREGFEIFLSTLPILLTENFSNILTAFFSGSFLSFLAFFLVYKASSFVSIKHVLNINSFLLVLFAAGLLVRGIHELTDTNIFPHLLQNVNLTIGFLPEKTNFFGDILYSIFGFKNYFTFLEASSYVLYLSSMSFYFAKKA